MSQSSVLTRWSVVLAAGQGDAVGREALAWLCRQYWEALCAHIRRRGWREDEELAQDFLTSLIERGSLGQVDPGRGRFRSWLLTCLDHFLANHAAAGKAAKRGGGRAPESLDGLASNAGDPGDAFDRDWALQVIRQAEDRLEAGMADARRYAALRPFLQGDGDAAAYRACGATLGSSELAIKVAVHRLRQRFRELVRESIAETLAESDPAAIDAELDCLTRALAGKGM
jgi:DNA-directed RNA polymerase specialized sigma24 family protein